MKHTIVLTLDQRIRNSSNDQLDAWQEQSSNNEKVIKSYCESKGFSPEFVTKFARDFYNYEKVAFCEFTILGCITYGAVAMRDGNIDTKLVIVTPSSFYSSQGVSLYSSNNDPRMKAVDQSFYELFDEIKDDFENGSQAWEAATEEISSMKDELIAQIWKEQRDMLFNSTFVTVPLNDEK